MFRNIIWDIIGKFGNQAIAFGISILLTRLLSPSEYGIMGMSLVIVSFAHIFLDIGFNSALIQQKEVSEIQYSSIFFLNFFIALILTVACFFLAGPIAAFYKQPLVKPVFRVLSLNFLFNGLNLIPSTLLYKRLNFKLNTILSLVAIIIAGTIGVILAYKGYGVWALVMQQVLSAAIILILNFWFVGWLPSMAFKFSTIKPLWSYGSRMFASGILNSVFERLDILLVGKIFSSHTLGFYTRAQTMDNFVRQFSAGSIMSTLFPFIAKHQHDRAFLKEIYIRFLNIILFISVGISGVLFLVAKNFFIILFTEKWLFSAELFQILAVGGFMWPICSLMVNIIAGLGNSRAFLRLEIFKKAFLLPAYLVGLILGIKGFVGCVLVASAFAVVMNMLFVSKEIEVGMKEQANIILRYMIVGFLSVLIVYLLSSFVTLNNHIAELVLKGGLFTIIYLTIATIAKLNGTQIINITFDKLKLAIR